MNKGMGDGVTVVRKGLAAALVCAAAGVVFVTAPYAFGVEADSHRFHEGDPSLSLNAGDENRFSKPISVSGEVWAVETHDPDGNHPFLKLLVTDDERRFGLYGEQAELLRVGSRVRVSGALAREAAEFKAAVRADILVNEVTVLERPSRHRTGVERSGKQGFIAAFLSWPGSGPSTYPAAAGSVSDLTEWSEEASGGVFNWDPAVPVKVELPEPLPSCGAGNEAPLDAWVNTVRSALAGKGYELAEDFRTLGLVMPEGARICGQVETAYAFYSGGCKWIESLTCGLSLYTAQFSTLDVFVHELGHNLSLPHANMATCTSGGNAIVLGYGGGIRCENQEYADVLDPMGFGFLRSRANYFNPVFSDSLGWIGPREIERVPRKESVDREVALAPFSAIGKKRTATVGLPIVGGQTGPISPGRIYIDYRTRTGLDAMLWDEGSAGRWNCPTGAADAVYLRLLPSAAGRQLLGMGGPILATRVDNSFLLDMTPATSPASSWEWICDAGLQPGDSWEDPTGKLKIDFLRRAADLSTATLRIRSEGTEGSGPTLELEKVGEGRGKIVIEEAGIECEGKCTHELEDESRLTARAIPARGSVFKYWAPDPSSPPGCGQLSSNPTCSFIPEWGQRKVLRAYFEPDLNLPRPDIELSAIQLTPATLKLKSGKSAKLTVEVTNSGLDEGEAKVALSSSSPAKAKVPGSVSFKVPGESSATRSFTVSTVKKQKGKVTITAKLGSQTAQASLVLAK